ncbi:MAG: hypothetical protein OXF46_02245 [Rhodobacteraceae bacterium]|nr:hypothetical protein [Paracoccaceae bacterium]
MALQLDPVVETFCSTVTDTTALIFPNSWSLTMCSGSFYGSRRHPLI